MSIVFDEVNATVERPQRQGDEQQPDEGPRPTAVFPTYALIHLRRELERLRHRKTRLRAD